MKRRTFLGRIAAAAGVLVAGAKAVAAAKPNARTAKQLANFNKGTRIGNHWTSKYYDGKYTEDEVYALRQYIDSRLRYMVGAD